MKLAKSNVEDRKLITSIVKGDQKLATNIHKLKQPVSKRPHCQASTSHSNGVSWDDVPLTNTFLVW
jgi:hypothetical protein